MTDRPPEEQPRRLEEAARLRAAAERCDDPDEKRRLLDSAVEYEGLSLTGAASHRAT